MLNKSFIVSFSLIASTALSSPSFAMFDKDEQGKAGVNFRALRNKFNKPPTQTPLQARPGASRNTMGESATLPRQTSTKTPASTSRVGTPSPVAPKSTAQPASRPLQTPPTRTTTTSTARVGTPSRAVPPPNAEKSKTRTNIEALNKSDKPSNHTPLQARPGASRNAVGESTALPRQTPTKTTASLTRVAAPSPIAPKSTAQPPSRPLPTPPIRTTTTTSTARVGIPSRAVRTPNAEQGKARTNFEALRNKFDKPPTHTPLQARPGAPRNAEGESAPLPRQTSTKTTTYTSRVGTPSPVAPKSAAQPASRPLQTPPTRTTTTTSTARVGTPSRAVPPPNAEQGKARTNVEALRNKFDKPPTHTPLQARPGASRNAVGESAPLPRQTPTKTPVSTARVGTPSPVAPKPAAQPASRPLPTPPIRTTTTTPATRVGGPNRVVPTPNEEKGKTRTNFEALRNKFDKPSNNTPLQARPGASRNAMGESTPLPRQTPTKTPASPTRVAAPSPVASKSTAQPASRPLPTPPIRTTTTSTTRDHAPSHAAPTSNREKGKEKIYDEGLRNKVNKPHTNTPLRTKHSAPSQTATRPVPFPVETKETIITISGLKGNQRPSFDPRKAEEIQILNLSDNHQKSLPLGLKSMVNLKMLDFSENELETLSPEIRYLKKLLLLNLYKNKLKNLPEGFGDLSDLMMVDLSKNELRHLPLSLMRAKDLLVLSLNKNKLQSLPEDIGKLKNLMRLDLAKNELLGLPQGIGKLRELNILDVSKNELIHLPKTIGNLEELKVLDLSFNKLSDLPPTIGNLNELEYLDLGSNNRLRFLPREMSELKNLRFLNLLNNSNLSLSASNASLLDLADFPNLRFLCVDGSQMLSSEMEDKIRDGEVKVAHDTYEMDLLIASYIEESNFPSIWEDKMEEIGLGMAVVTALETANLPLEEAELFLKEALTMFSEEGSDSEEEYDPGESDSEEYDPGEGYASKEKRRMFFRDGEE